MLQLAISHIALALTLGKCHLNILERKGNGCTINIFIMCLEFSARWITIMKSSFTLQHTPPIRSCNYLSLLVLWNVSSDLSFTFGHMFSNISKWHVLVWIVIIKINNGLVVLGTIHSIRRSSFFLLQNVSMLRLKDCKTMNVNFGICTLKLCPISKFGIVIHLLHLTACGLPLTTYCSTSFLFGTPKNIILFQNPKCFDVHILLLAEWMCN